MKKTIVLFLVLFLTVACLTLSAQQTRCKVTGIVSAANDHTLPYASVYILKHDSVIAGTLTNQGGRFEMEIVQTKDSCLLTVVFMGYKTKQLPFVANTLQISLGTILMEAASRQLDEIYVTAKQEGGTYVDVTQTRLLPTDATQWMGGSIGDVLRTEPSVTIDPNGNISLRGNGNVLLLLDGVPTNLGSIDAIPSSNVASINIIKNPNATYDAEGTGGIINIVTKKGTARGLSGMASVNYGFNHFVNGSLALNYTKNKFAFRFNYQLKYEDDVNNGYLYRYYRTASRFTPCKRFLTIMSLWGSPSNPTSKPLSILIYG